ncbi:hypothetical protein [Melissospora conviva]|uniref:hypothetical protein n=1 Tax=Melissospora conviva TaxID=3388432 RepID=UPI003B78AB4B
MAHLELALSEVLTLADDVPPCPRGLGDWGSTVRDAEEPCLLIDARTTVSAISASGCAVLGFGSPAEIIGRPLLAGGLRLLDFTASRCDLTEQEVDKIPPLLALSSGRLARGLLRVCRGNGADRDRTLDAISTPVLRRGEVAGSLTFLAEV